MRLKADTRVLQTRLLSIRTGSIATVLLNWDMGCMDVEKFMLGDTKRLTGLKRIIFRLSRVHMMVEWRPGTDIAR